jgi:hypothetical protein
MYEQFLHLIDDKKQGALRVSVGLATNFSDVYHFLQFARTIIDRSDPPSLAEQTRLSPESVPRSEGVPWRATRTAADLS